MGAMNHAAFYTEPAPHLRLRQLIDPDQYRAARFPELEPRPGGRIGRDLYPSDPEFSKTCHSHGWGALWYHVTDMEFVRTVISHFADAMRERKCLVDPDDWTLEPYDETRAETEMGDLGSDLPPNALFTRFDFQAAGADYVKPPHVDWPRRLIGGVLFCCDADDEGLEGGEFGLYRDTAVDSPPRICREPALALSYPAQHNTGVLFLNGPDGFHGPTPVTQCAGQRRWIYYSISSRHPIWPT